MRHERRASRGFTLIELLTVIVIIVLLVAILFPAISAVTRTAYDSRTQARIHELAAGAIAYKNDCGFYPGQASASNIGVDYTGTQILAWCLFTDVLIDDGGVSYPNRFTLGDDTIRYDGQNRNLRYNAQPVPKPKYAPVKEGDIATYDGVPTTISDRYGADKALPILYYPSRLGDTTLGQYIVADNWAYQQDGGNIVWHHEEEDVYPANSLEGSFWRYIKDRRFNGNDSGTPYKTGEFILIGAGQDRLFGTADDRKNW